MSKPELWREKIGKRGATVWVQERTPGGNLYLRWRDQVAKQWVWQSLGHADRAKALEEAGRQYVALVEGREAVRRRVVTLAYIFAEYEREESVHKKGRGHDEDCRRMDVWQAWLGPHYDVSKLTPALIKRFIRERRAGRVKVPDRKLDPNPSDTTIGKDIGFLSRVLTWASGEGMIEANPIRDVKIPRNVNKKRPVATYDRFLAIRPHCEGLFGPFMDLIEALGWRVSAIRQLRASDLDLRSRPGAPRGRILKRAETDKKGVERWVPLSADARAAIDAVLSMNPVVGDRYLFPAPKAKGKPWGLRYVYDRLRKAEDAAGLEHLDGGAFHPYRRKWRRERKHLPRADVAEAGAWLSLQSLDIYDGADDETLLAVIEEPRKLRDAR